RSITYSNTSEAPSTAPRTVRFVVSDGNDPSSPANRTINVNAVNDAPVNTAPGAQSVGTTQTHVFSTANGNGLSIADVDAGASVIQATVSVSGGNFSLSTIAGLSFSFSDGNGTGSGTGTHDTTATFRGTIAAINAALEGLTFTAPGSSGTVTLA